MTDVAELTTLVEQLQKRVEALEAQLERHFGTVDEDVLVAIAAAVSAYLGNNARVKQVHYRGPSGWAASGRRALQNKSAFGSR